jgi:DNA polymerase III subunit epsilon
MSYMTTITAPEPAPLVSAAARPLLFLDFEASSLSTESWPVEIGWAVIDGGRVVSDSALIAPRPEWPLADWSESAFRVHGIMLDDAFLGLPAEAAAEATDRFAGFDVVSDNPLWEQHWLDRLRAGRPRVTVLPLRQAMAERMTADEANRFCRALLRSTPAHRAEGDAARLAGAWAAALTEPAAA